MNSNANGPLQRSLKKSILEHLKTHIRERGPLSVISLLIVVIMGIFHFASLLIHSETEGNHSRKPNVGQAIATPSAKPMPLTGDSIIEMGRQLNKPYREFLQSMTQENDLTKPVVEIRPIKADPRFESASFDRELIRRMGYDYNLTVREVARNRQTLESRVQALILSDIGKHAAGYRNELLQEKLIDPETFRILNAAYPVDER